MNAKQRQLEERLSKKETEVINFGKVKMMFYSDVNGLINIDFLFKKTIDCLINIWFLFLIEWETQGSCHEITRKNKWARQIDHSLWESHWIFLFLFIWNSSIYCHNFLSSHISLVYFHFRAEKDSRWQISRGQNGKRYVNFPTECDSDKGEWDNLTKA